MVASNQPYIEHEFQTFIEAQFGMLSAPSPTMLAILRRTFFAGAQSIYIGLHQSSGVPETDFMNEVGDEIGAFVIAVKENNGH